MNKKGSMELSVNSIVVLVIAIVIMGLILGFIRSKFAEVGGNLVTNEPEPMTASNDDRITLSREAISVVPGSQAVLKVNIYNPMSIPLNKSSPLVNCTGLKSLTVTTNNKTLKEGSQTSFIISLSTARDENRGRSALCSVTVTTTTVAGAGGTGNTFTPAALAEFQAAFSPKDFVVQVN